MGFSDYLNSMYVWTTSLLIIIIGLTSYVLQIFPLNLIIAVVLCSLLDLLIKKIFLKKDLKIPYSAIITGIIIGAIAPFTSSYLVIILASVVAILSKHFIRLKSHHVFNPATLGLLVSLLLFNLRDEWWAASGISVLGIIIPLTIFLVVANYKADNFFIFIMLSEPKTSPYIGRDQVVFGIGISVLVLVLEISKISYPFFIALLVGNFVYAIYRNYRNK